MSKGYGTLSIPVKRYQGAFSYRYIITRVRRYLDTFRLDDRRVQRAFRTFGSWCLFTLRQRVRTLVSQFRFCFQRGRRGTPLLSGLTARFHRVLEHSINTHVFWTDLPPCWGHARTDKNHFVHALPPVLWSSLRPRQRLLPLHPKVVAPSCKPNAPPPCRQNPKRAKPVHAISNAPRWQRF